MTEVSIAPLPASQLHALELWSNHKKAATRIKKACGLTLPETGRSASKGDMRLTRFEPTVWLVEGETGSWAEVLGDDGALTAIGGGIVRVEIKGAGWRRLLMEGGVFDAENPAFAPGSSASTIIDHVNVRLLVTDWDTCLAYVPASYAAAMIQFWQIAAKSLD